MASVGEYVPSLTNLICKVREYLEGVHPLREDGVGVGESTVIGADLGRVCGQWEGYKVNK